MHNIAAMALPLYFFILFIISYLCSSHHRQLSSSSLPILSLSLSFNQLRWQNYFANVVTLRLPHKNGFIFLLNCFSHSYSHFWFGFFFLFWLMLMLLMFDSFFFFFFYFFFFLAGGWQLSHSTIIYFPSSQMFGVLVF